MSINDYKDPIITRLRDGSSSDPYRDITDSLQVSNGAVVLTEIPSEFHRVTVSGASKTWYEITNGLPKENEYLVNYTNKVIKFHESNNGKRLTFDYYGKGLQFVPHTMIYTGEDNGEVTETLDVFMTDLKDSTINEVTTTTANLKGEMQATIDSAKSATLNANQSAENADVKALLAQDKANYANEKGNYANTKAQYAQDIADNINVQSRYIRKNPVANYSAISTTYPTPEIGWVTVTLDNGKVYRYDSVSWVHIDTLSSTIVNSIVSDVGDKVNLTTTNKNTIVEAINEVKSTVDNYFWMESHDSGIVINHNLNDYPLATIVANDSTGHGGYGEYAIGSKYQVLNKIEYLSENSIRLHLFQSETFTGSPSVTGSGLRYNVSFSGEDSTLSVLLFQSSPTYV